VEENDLHAWVDGRLTADRKKAVEDYFAAHPEVRDRWRQYVNQRAALRAAIAAQTTGPIPARLRVASLLAERRCWRQ
jgi:anti-sigma factor RsiW